LFCLAVGSTLRAHQILFARLYHPQGLGCNGRVKVSARLARCLSVILARILCGGAGPRTLRFPAQNPIPALPPAPASLSIAAI